MYKAKKQVYSSIIAKWNHGKNRELRFQNPVPEWVPGPQFLSCFSRSGSERESRLILLSMRALQSDGVVSSEYRKRRSLGSSEGSSSLLVFMTHTTAILI